MDKPVLKLKPEVAEKYSLAKDYPMIGAHPTFGQIDLSLVNLEAATQLVDAGFEGLILKPNKAAK